MKFNHYDSKIFKIMKRSTPLPQSGGNFKNLELKS